MWAGVILVLLYLSAVLLPLVLLAIIGRHGTYTPVYEIGRSFALAAFCILALQSLLTARLKWVERPFGLDVVSRFHKSMGIFAVALLMLHPLLLAFGGGGLSLLVSLDLPWYIWAGKIALILLVIHVALSVLSPAFPFQPVALTFEQWRIPHFVLAPFIVIVAFVHAWNSGSDFALMWIRVYWIAMITIFSAAFIVHKFLKPAELRRHPYTVGEVEKETHNVWTVKLSPPEGQSVFEYEPGQFHFITLYRGHGLPAEEHHWTISSSPSQRDFISSTIKESGDFTSTIGRTKPGDRAVVQGPFGRFSYVFHPEDRDMVFIAGGIGITPMMSMLRHMRDTKYSSDVLLIYANRSEEDMVFRDELESLQKGEPPRLNVVHLLSRPQESWNGETGRLDREKLQRLAGDGITKKVFYICGPPGMMDSTVHMLSTLGVSLSRIRIEYFSL